MFQLLKDVWLNIAQRMFNADKERVVTLNDKCKAASPSLATTIITVHNAT